MNSHMTYAFNSRKALRLLLIATFGWLPLLSVGCAEETWQAKFGWKAEEYFEDADVIALCHAIEKRDFEEIDWLIADGVDVNTVGKNGMTPLLWAYPGNDLELFEHILEQGADPNVILTGRVGKKVSIRPGDSVMSVCAKTYFPGYLEAVLKHGGDPNIVNSWHDCPIHSVITSGGRKRERIKILVDAGADLNSVPGDYTPVMLASSWGGGDFELAIYLLEIGADPTVRRKTQLTNYVEFLCLAEAQKSQLWSASHKKRFADLVSWLEEHGYDVDSARADVKRWLDDMNKRRTSHFKSTLLYKELSERVKQEQAEKQRQQETEEVS